MSSLIHVFIYSLYMSTFALKQYLLKTLISYVFIRVIRFIARQRTTNSLTPGTFFCVLFLSEFQKTPFFSFVIIFVRNFNQRYRNHPSAKMTTRYFLFLELLFFFLSKKTFSQCVGRSHQGIVH